MYPMVRRSAPLDFNAIEPEIRSLIKQLNRIPYIRTFASCSGHPAMPHKQWVDGWITLVPGDATYVWDFVEVLQARLDNVKAAKVVQYYSEQGLCYHDKVFEFYKRVDAEKLFLSSIPILTTHICSCVFPWRVSVDARCVFWDEILKAVGGFDPSCECNHSDIRSEEAGARRLVQWLKTSRHVQGIALYQGTRGTWRVEFEALSNRSSFEWCWRLTDHVRKRFQELLSTEDCLVSHTHIILRPVVMQTDRTREDHLKIWKLIEFAATELMREMGIPDCEEWY